MVNSEMDYLFCHPPEDLVGEKQVNMARRKSCISLNPANSWGRGPYKKIQTKNLSSNIYYLASKRAAAAAAAANTCGGAFSLE